MKAPRVIGALVYPILLAVVAARAGAIAEPGEAGFLFSDWAGPPIAIHLYVPEGAKPSTPIVIVMHGASRDAIRYFDDWKVQGETHRFIVVVPELTQEAFPKSARYNLGHVFDTQTDERRPEELWTFSAIEPLFDRVVALVGSNQSHYTIFGHSAGSQFVHRFLYYKPCARVSRAIAANAGWYTIPDFGVEYPYGLGNSGVDESILAGMFKKDVVILLGEKDIEENTDNLRQTPEAELQGPHRFARGQTMYRVARARAKKLGVEFNWRLEFVSGAGHVNAQMTPAAALLVEQDSNR